MTRNTRLLTAANVLKSNLNNSIKVPITLSALVLCAASASAATLYSEGIVSGDYPAGNQSSIDGVNGWAVTTNDVYFHTGASGEFRGENAGASNDFGSAFTSTITVPTTAGGILTFSFNARVRGNDGNGLASVSVTNALGAPILTIGGGGTGNNFFATQGATSLFDNAGTGTEDIISTTSHQRYDFNVTFNTATGAGVYTVDRTDPAGTDAPTMIGTFTGTAFDATTIGGVGVGMDGNSARMGNIDVQFDPVPEPSSTALLGLGGLAFILRRRR